MDTLYIWLQTWRNFPYADAIVVVFLFVLFYQYQKEYIKLLFGFVLLHWFILNPIVQNIISAIVDSSLYWRLPDSIILLRYLLYFSILNSCIYHVLKMDRKYKKIFSAMIAFSIFLSPVQQLLNLNSLIKPSIGIDNFTIFNKDQYEGPEKIVNIFENPHYLDNEIVKFLDQVNKEIPKRSKVLVTEESRLLRFSRYLTTIESVNYGKDNEYITACLNPENEMVNIAECREKEKDLDYKYAIIKKFNNSKNDYYNDLVETSEEIVATEIYTLRKVVK